MTISFPVCLCVSSLETPVAQSPFLFFSHIFVSLHLSSLLISLCFTISLFSSSQCLSLFLFLSVSLPVFGFLDLSAISVCLCLFLSLFQYLFTVSPSFSGLLSLSFSPYTSASMTRPWGRLWSACGGNSMEIRARIPHVGTAYMPHPSGPMFNRACCSF